MLHTWNCCIGRDLNEHLVLPYPVTREGHTFCTQCHFFGQPGQAHACRIVLECHCFTDLGVTVLTNCRDSGVPPEDPLWGLCWELRTDLGPLSPGRLSGLPQSICIEVITLPISFLPMSTGTRVWQECVLSSKWVAGGKIGGGGSCWPWASLLVPMASACVMWACFQKTKGCM